MAYQPSTKWAARMYEFREVVARDDSLRELLRLLRDRFPDAFAGLCQRLDALWDKRVAEARVEVPPAMADVVNEGSIEEPKEPVG